MRSKVLVTGANGQLAKTLAKLYNKNDHDLDFVFATKKELDITLPKEVKKFIKNNNFDYCINCAAYTNVELAEKTPKVAIKINAEAVKNLAQVCLQTDTILIHISTDYVFDGKKETPYTEEDVPNPLNKYGKSKLLGEQNIQKTLKKYFIIRTSWLYSNFGKNFLKTVVNNINDDKNLQIISSQKGAPTSTYNLAKFIYFLTNNKITDYGIFHFTDKDIVSWYDFSKAIVNTHNKSKLHLISNTNISFSKIIRPNYSALNNTKRLSVFKEEVLLGNSIKEVISLL